MAETDASFVALRSSLRELREAQNAARESWLQPVAELTAAATKARSDIVRLRASLDELGRAASAGGGRDQRADRSDRAGDGPVRIAWCDPRFDRRAGGAAPVSRCAREFIGGGWTSLRSEARSIAHQPYWLQGDDPTHSRPAEADAMTTKVDARVCARA